jgi:hypothetical protein
MPPKPAKPAKPSAKPSVKPSAKPFAKPSSDDIEGIHMYEDALYEQFIMDVHRGKLRTLKQIQDSAAELAKVVRKRKKSERWFA